MGALDRDKAREVLWPLWDSAQMDDGEIDAMLDGLEPCVVSAPAQTIDRDALVLALYRLLSFSAGFDEHVQDTADSILALVVSTPPQTIDLAALDAELLKYAPGGPGLLTSCTRLSSRCCGPTRTLLCSRLRRST